MPSAGPGGTLVGLGVEAAARTQSREISPVCGVNSTYNSVGGLQGSYRVVLSDLIVSCLPALLQSERF